MTPENDRDPADPNEADPNEADPNEAEHDGAAGNAREPGADADAPDTTDGTDPAADEATDADSAGANGDGAEAEIDVEPTLEERLAASEALAAAHWDRLVRLQAEMENQRKRAQRDVASARKFALDGIAGDLLPVKDSLELGIRAAAVEEASLANLVEGSELTLKMLAQVLEKNAIHEVNPEGEKFDPEFHQAMSMQAVEGVPPNTVTAVMQKGYTLNERLLRPALVMVSK